MTAAARDTGTILVGSLVAIALVVLVSIAAMRVTVAVESTVGALFDRGLVVAEVARFERTVTRATQAVRRVGIGPPGPHVPRDPIDSSISIANDASGLVVRTADGYERFRRLRVLAVRTIRSPLPALVVDIAGSRMVGCWTIVAPFALIDPDDDR